MTTRKTASNSPFLANIKRAMNDKIFREASRLMNAEGEGATRAYLQRFFSRPLDEVFGRPDAR